MPLSQPPLLPSPMPASLAPRLQLQPDRRLVVTFVVVLGAIQPARISLANGAAAAGLGSKSQFAAPDAEATAEAGDTAQS